MFNMTSLYEKSMQNLACHHRDFDEQGHEVHFSPLLTPQIPIFFFYSSYDFN